MTMLSLSRRLGITPRADHEYDPTAAGWLDSGRPDGAHQEVGQQPLVPQQWAGTSAVRDRERAHYAADDHAASGPIATARGSHPLGAESEAAPPGASGPGFDAGLAETRPIDRRSASASAEPDGVWPEICDQFGSHMLVLAEQLRATLNVLEDDESDPERLRRLYQVDHAVTRMRLASRQLVTLAGRSEERVAGFTTSMLDVIRMASSAIEWYPQVAIGSVAELAVPGYAADDVATLMSALLDNATRYSPGMVTVSCHLLEHGGVMFRIEDTGLGMARDQIMRLNLALAGAVPDVSESTARHTGFPVVHRIARKHSIGVRFASRRPPGTGTLAMVTLPPQLVCAIPARDPLRRPAAAEWSPSAPTAAGAAPDLPRREGTGLVEAESAQPALPDAAPPDAPPLELTSPDAAPRELTSAQPELPEPVAPEPISPPPAEPMSPEAQSPQSPSPEADPSEPVAPQRVASEPLPSAPASPEPAAAEAGQDPPPSELPRREPAGLRVEERKPAEAAAPPPPQPQQAAARLAFANDLSAFSQGIQEALAARGITGGLVSALFDGPVIKEGAQS